LDAGSPPASRAATVISLLSLENIFPRLASVAAFLCLMLDHLLCPAMLTSYFETFEKRPLLPNPGVRLKF
jgi:hypothetical protein